MFKYLRLKGPSEDLPPAPGTLSSEMLSRDSTSSISIRNLNNLPENTKRRLYRSLLPVVVYSRLNIDPITWDSLPDGLQVHLKAEPDTGLIKLTVVNPMDRLDEICAVELQDNTFGSIDLNLLVLGNPDSDHFNIDRDESGEPTMFGTLRRNLTEEECALQNGLAPGQARAGLGASRTVFEQLEGFLAALGQRAYFLEPLTYASAWVFERRGFAYMRGHRLMENIHSEFQPGGRLHKALDGSTPFRQPEQWNSVRGRAWAIQDGILESIGTRWDQLRMIKQIGRQAGVNTFPGGVF